MKIWNHNKYIKEILLLSCLFGSVSAFSQTVISGKVRDQEKKNGVENVNVMLREKADSPILGFVLTDKEGNYKLEYKGSNDSILVQISGFNIKQEQKRLESRTQTIHFDISFESVSLKEVKITPPKIRQRGDTINYSVSGFLDQNDRTIGDVLKKLPGIDVKESGQILYQNKPINKFYIEDMDLLQGKYGLATNNISAKDVSTVQVMENHQPIKSLKDKVVSEQAALNLKLKDSAKGTLTANALLGAGFSPLLWNGELSALYFGKGKQNISTYKGNNSGDDVSRELTSFYSNQNESLSQGGLLGIQSPSSPPIRQKRYLFNRAHTVSFNNLWKIKDYQLNANLNYLNDRHDKSSYAETEYYLPGKEILKVQEIANSRSYIHNANADIQLNSNKDKYYLNNLVKFNGSWDNEEGDAFASQPIRQQLDKPSFGISNTFDLIKNYEKTDINLSSFIGYSTLPHSLLIRPLLYPEIVGDENPSEGMRQETEQKRFVSNNKISAGYKHGRLNQNYALNFRTNLQNLSSDLSPEGFSSNLPDSLRNDLKFDQYQWTFTPSYSYRINDLHINLSLPVNYLILDRNDRIRKNEESESFWYLNPRLFFNWKLSAFWNLSGNAGLNNNFGGIGNEYTGYIMQTYRNLKRNTGDTYQSENQNYSISLDYRNPLYAFFGNMSLSYFSTKANLLYGYDYSDILMTQKSLAIPNYTEGYSIQTVASKMVDGLSSTFRLAANYSGNSSSNLSQGEIVHLRGENYSISPSIDSKIRSFASLSYSCSFAESKNRIRETDRTLDPIRTITQNARLSLFPLKTLTINLSYENFYNNAIASGNRSMSFGDIGIKYKLKNTEFLLDCTNIFNSKQYISANYNDISSYYYAYDLRPAEILLRIRFKLL